MTSGIELATEWVTILPETATLVKELKKFKPPPIHVELVVDSKGNAASVIDKKKIVKEAEKAGEQAGEAMSDSAKRAIAKEKWEKEGIVDAKKVVAPSKKAGEAIAREIIKPIQNVNKQIEAAVSPKDNGRIRQAAQRIGDVIRDAVTKGAGDGGDQVGKKLAASIERAKSAVVKAERSLADARAAAANIESRIQQSEARVQQLRKASAEGLKNVAAEEKRYSDMRANASQHTADEIAAQERRVAAAQTAQENRDARLQAAQLSRNRLNNSEEQSTNRVANAKDNLGAREAALASSLALANDPLEENNKKMKQGGLMAGGMMASLIPLGRQMLVTSGLFTGALGLAGGITYTLKTGNEFTDTINRMQGILGRTSGQMGDISGKARELGRDFTLPATSANDAATAMLELTKAGFSADQAMDAAKGSLQLSAAAGISAAEAATITGTSLNAYGLQATDAAKVTDLLANAANLFPGEMTDFGYSLSQAGAVAKSFGIDIEDTTTALGFLAKAGIKSSDAGTLIKTMLLSLTDQGKPAQNAIHELGLELYDQNHNFKGIEYVYKRLGEASKEMTQEQYQAATATLFGTDAARFAGLAAGDAAPNWDEFRDKIEKTGTAAEVANARMQGLPGAMERLKNAGQELALTIYDMVKGPLEDVVNAVARIVLAFAEWLQGPAIEFFKKYKEEIFGVAAVLGTYVGILAAIKIATMAWTAVQWALNAALDANPIGVIVLAIAALVAGVIYAYKHFEGFRNVVDTVGRALRDAWVAALPALKEIGSAIKTFWDNVLVPFGKWLGSTWLSYAKFMWNNVWVPAFKAIGTVIMWVWNNVLKPFIGWISANWPAISAAFSAGWSVIKTIFDAWKTAISFLWNNVLKPAFAWIAAQWKIVWFAVQVGWEVGKRVFEAVGDVAMWLWHTILEPAFKGIGEIIMVAWNFIKEAFEGWKIAFGIVGDAAMWLWNTIFKPVWEGIKAGWDVLWKYLSPIFDIFKAGMQGIGDVASKIADGIRKAWSGLVEVFKIPLHALGSMLAGIPDTILGVEVPFVADLHNWGKSLQGLRSGGIISGPGTGTSDSLVGLDQMGVPTVRVSNGEGVVPEKSLSTPLGQMLFSMLLGMRGGGTVKQGNVPWPPEPIGPSGREAGGIPSIFGGGPGGNNIAIPDWGTPGTIFGPPPGDWWDKPINPNDILFPEWMPPGVRDRWLEQWGINGKKIKGLKDGGVAGSRNDGLNPGAGALSDMIKRMFGVSDIGGRRSEDGYGEHSSGNAMDIMIGSDTAKGNSIAGFLKTNKDSLGIDGMIWNHTAYGYGSGWEGRPYSGPNPHTDHVHVILGKGRGAGAAPAPLPSGPLIDAEGRDVTGGSTVAGSASSYRKPSTEKQIREANDRVTDRTNQLNQSQARLDEYEAKRTAGETVKQSTIDTATNQRDKFARELDQAKADLEEVKQGKLVEGTKSKSGSSDSNDWSSVGGMIFSGFLESFGLDGSVFTNLFDTPNVKSAMAGLNFGLSLLGGGQDTGASDSTGGLASTGLPGDDGGGILGVGTDLLSGIGDSAGIQFQAQGAGDAAVAGAYGGPTVVMNQPNLGVSPGAMDDKIGEMTAASKRATTLPKP